MLFQITATTLTHWHKIVKDNVHLSVQIQETSQGELSFLTLTLLPSF